MSRRTFAAAVVSLCVLHTGLCWALDWPQFRGPRRDGLAPGLTLPSGLPAKLSRAWEVEVGAGYSAPSVVGDRVVVLARQGESEVLLCLRVEDGAGYSAPSVVGDRVVVLPRQGESEVLL
jgi:hypothetical protein